MRGIAILMLILALALISPKTMAEWRSSKRTKSDDDRDEAVLLDNFDEIEQNDNLKKLIGKVSNLTSTIGTKEKESNHIEPLENNDPSL